uniref:Uncharacterized protein n=1 Tax=Cacopsylla melanoneura TaxID=428564 RepID=A0A8D8ZQ13_9HEMI
MLHLRYYWHLACYFKSSLFKSRIIIVPLLDSIGILLDSTGGLLDINCSEGEPCRSEACDCNSGAARVADTRSDGTRVRVPHQQTQHKCGFDKVMHCIYSVLNGRFFSINAATDILNYIRKITLYSWQDKIIEKYISSTFASS